jgi:hypothetical protein
MRTRHARREALHCCPACAASLGVNRRRRSRPQWAWVTLLGAVAALVPFAAMEGGGGPAVASAAPAVAQTAPATPAPVPKPRERAPKPVARPAVEWRDSHALGTANDGSLADGVRLPREGPGFYTYNPATQQPPGGSERTWGTDTLVRQILGLGAWWAKANPGAPRLGIGDLSLEHGGPFTGPVVGHASHENGLDVDIRLVRRDGAEGAVTASTYDQERTQKVVDFLVAHGASLVLKGPSLNLYGPPGVVVTWPNHDDHIHARFPNPG